MPQGRPFLFKTPEDLQKAVDAYFESCLPKGGKPGRPFTITGLALALKTSRQTLINYETQEHGASDEMADIIKEAKLRVENFYEERLTLQHATGPIFALKNFGWKDTQTMAGDKENPIIGKIDIVHVKPK